jgi:drug/metabolite transporter (DMT)-like permease
MHAGGPTASTTVARDLSIWGFAFGYFAAYVPYSALTKALSKGLLDGMEKPIDGFVLLPSTVIASMVSMFIFLSAMRWWKFATQRKVGSFTLPSPRLRTLLSGTCTACIVVTTTLAYTFEGISIVFAMLLMRGGVLVIAPMVDALSRRKVKWYSWVALVLSLAALLVAFAEKSGYALTFGAGLDIGIYLLSYFVRLRIMSGAAKSSDANENKRFFVEEQMVATPLVVVVLSLWALSGIGSAAPDLRAGFLDIWASPVILTVLLVGVFSQGTGVFGGLILLDKRENTFCVPVNRASSILAGVVASFSLAAILDTRTPSVMELFGAGLIVMAIVVLSVPPLVEKQRAAKTT